MLTPLSPEISIDGAQVTPYSSNMSVDEVPGDPRVTRSPSCPQMNINGGQDKDPVFSDVYRTDWGGGGGDPFFFSDVYK